MLRAAPRDPRCKLCPFLPFLASSTAREIFLWNISRDSVLRPSWLIFCTAGYDRYTWAITNGLFVNLEQEPNALTGNGLPEVISTNFQKLEFAVKLSAPGGGTSGDTIFAA